MPELPEVETVRRGLDKLLIGKVIASEQHDSPKSFPNSSPNVNKFLIGATVIAVRRRAKVLIIDLSTKYSLMIHLKMTGQLVFVKSQKLTKNTSLKERKSGRWGAGHPSSSLVNKLPDKTTRVTLCFFGGSKLYFNDQRKFGWMKLLPTELILKDPFMLKVGPEPLEPEITNKIFVQRIRRRNGTTVKAAILDQTVLAGVGNIYADESLWAAKIHPSERVRDLKDSQLYSLRKEIVYVLNLSIENGGSTSRNYVSATGEKGSYLKQARVFGRQGKACSRCGALIEKIKVAGRGTHICSVCQLHYLDS